jgi:YesN/AraC family two-component response regulator
MKVLIVDDEAIIREGMRSMISWEEAGFTELLEAADAHEALELIEARRPDLIITDIFMPEMSGIEFAEKVKDKYPSIQIIILTGYEKFEYAKEAIRIGVAQYMVKPLFPEELAAVVREVTSGIEKQRGEERWKQDAARRLNQYNPIVMEKFWKDLLSGANKNPQVITEQQRQFGISHDGQQIQCISIQIRPEIKASFYSKSDLQLLAYAVRNIAEEMFQDYNVHFCNVESFQLYAVFLEPVAVETLHHLHYNIEGLLKLNAFIGIGLKYKKLDELTLSAHEADEAAQLLLSTGESGVVRYDQLQDKKSSRVYYPYAQEKQLLQEMRFGTPQTHLGWLVPFVKVLNDQAAAFPVRKLIYVQLLSAVYRLADEYELEDVLGAFPQNYRVIEQAVAEPEIQSLFQQLFNRFVGGRSRAQAGYVERLVEEAICLIDQQYPNNLFSVGTIAEELNVSPKYLSRIFRKITGKTCIDYITQVRVDQAKEWLRSTSLRSLEIGEKVGYPNPNYFSLVFKKQTGMSPTEYRQAFGDVSS